MNKLTRAAALAVATLLGSAVAASADPIAIPVLEPWPATPEAVPVTLPNPCPTTGPKPAGCFPQPSGVVKPFDPAVWQALIQGQVDLIAAALATTPDTILATVLDTPVPTLDGTTETITETLGQYLERVAGTAVFDETSNGLLGLPEIAVGNISHAYSLSRAMPATSAPRCADPTKIAPCAEAPSPNLAKLPQYTKATSNWVPTIPTQTALGHSVVVPLATGILNGTTPAPPVTSVPGTGTPVTGDVPTGTVCPVPEVDPTLCAETLNRLKSNLLFSVGGPLVNIQGSDFWGPKSSTDSTVVKKAAHNGGTGLLNGHNIDTVFRSPTQADPYPAWVPLLTSASAISDEAVDFIGFSTSSAAPSLSCTNVSGGVKTFSIVDGVEVTNWPAQNCTSSGSFSGFGLAIYGKSPVNFRTDLAPLWSPAPPVVSQLSASATAIVAALTAYAPTTTQILAFEGALVAFVNAVKAQAPAAPATPTPPATPPLPTGVPPTAPPVPASASARPGLPSLGRLVSLP